MNIQSFPFHLVQSSPWPLATSISLLITTISSVLIFQGFNSILLLVVGLISLFSCMALWWKDVIIESIIINFKVFSKNLTICWKLLRAYNTFKVTIYKIEQSARNQKNINILSRIFRDYMLNINKYMFITYKIYNNYHTSVYRQSNNIIKFNTYNNINSYITGLLEGDGYIEIISEDSKSKNKNPRFVFTFHINNLDLFNEFKNFIDSGYFIKGSNNTMRFIIADIKGVIKLTNLINGYFRTPKIITFYKLINILNKKYSLNIFKLPINNSSLDSNAWLTGLTEADGYFGVIITEF